MGGSFALRVGRFGFGGRMVFEPIALDECVEVSIIRVTCVEIDEEAAIL